MKNKEKKKETHSNKGEKYRKTRKKLTVTFLSKKYLRVKLIPRTISVRNKVFMLRSKTAKVVRKSGINVKLID